jgi:hypothetical protein
VRLVDLQAELLQRLGEGRHWRGAPGVTLANAHGVAFLCPKCFKANGGPVGTHMVICWFVGKVPDDATPGPGRWTPAGTGIEDLTFVPGTPPRAKSVQLMSGCRWHGHVLNGDAS